MRMRAALAVVLCFCLAAGATAAAEEIRSVPVVTQVQGAVFYRTSITLSNGNPSGHDAGGDAVLVPFAGGRDLPDDDADAQPGPGPEPGALLRRHHPGVQERGPDPGRRRRAAGSSERCS